MPLVPQQDVVVITGPYQLEQGQRAEDAAAVQLKQALESYPLCRIVSVSCGSGNMHAYSLTAVVETI
jgi:hypothetical protein